jgi:hypothetical protein
MAEAVDTSGVDDAVGHYSLSVSQVPDVEDES